MILLAVLLGSFSFQNVALGISEAELRAVVPTLACTGEIRFLDVTPEQAAAGTKECAPTEMIGSSRVVADVSIGDYQGAIRYYVNNGVLARMEFWPDYPAADAVLAGLTQKYGRPKELKRGVWQAVSGRQVPSIKAVWKQGDQSIELQVPSTKIDKMTVIYSSSIDTERVLPAKM